MAGDPSQILKKIGLKVTKNREQVLSILQGSPRPLNHQEIMEKLPKEESWDRVTIYRALSDLEEKNLLNSLHSTDRVTYFELKSDGNHVVSAAHGHLICNVCGKIECIDDPWNGIPSAKHLKGFSTESVEIVFRGKCRNCQ
ncbi:MULTISPECIES: Fur family transcriptional regulator [Leptospira]|uniref:Transcriptional repressor n=4 Tax=Leptospira TaxID=171 RepID=A0AAW5VGY8_9LEPT|nr:MULTISPECIES: Fur family transcriptional regulator [Leptospira]EMY69046.1 ferric uptake regulator family protein [Leptospira vanthielii serovar Holland str. Waz Holland = ATCC 700522]MCG6144590.1 transcriptional repressor [Leptospira bandrabouensis]MCG6150402.1 transcriptional repressor [Leptospira bandrabouensis]MCG6160251.1 transcriptional repressor [Leptospira bandrabouensis]MCG6164184.1 transcriptional repressor [Leptospira bandrabouensis]